MQYGRHHTPVAWGTGAYKRMIRCCAKGAARQSKDIPEEDTCVLSLNRQTIEAMVPKKLEFTQEHQAEGREKMKSVPARRGTCLSERYFTQF